MLLMKWNVLFVFVLKILFWILIIFNFLRKYNFSKDDGFDGFIEILLLVMWKFGYLVYEGKNWLLELGYWIFSIYKNGNGGINSLW